MRVAFIFISMPVGGAEDFALAVARYFPETVEPKFVCLRSLGVIGEELQAEQRVSLVRAAPGKRLNLFGILRLACWMREERIDVVHSQTYHAHLYAVAAANWIGIPAVVHQQKTLAKMRWHREWFMKLATKRAAHILALSSKTKEEMEAAFSLDPNKVSVVPNAVDSALFAPAEERWSLRKELGLADRFLCGAIASLNAVKNHGATLSAYSEMRRRGHSFDGIFVGEGAGRPELEKLVLEYGLEGSVKLVGNKRPVAPWLRALDLLVLPSHWEGQPMVLLQALSCRIPIIASRIEGNVAALGEQHPALFDLKDQAHYNHLMERAIAEPQFRRQILDYQKKLPLPDAQAVSERLVALYRELAAV